MVVWGSCPVVALSGDGLMTSPPGGPGERLLDVVKSRPDDRQEQTSHLGFGQRDQIKLCFFICLPRLFFEVESLAAARITLSSARAAIDSVT